MQTVTETHDNGGHASMMRQNPALSTTTAVHSAGAVYSFGGPERTAPALSTMVVFAAALNATLIPSNVDDWFKSTSWEPSVSRHAPMFTLPMYLENAYRSAIELSELEDGWDGPGSSRPKAATISDAIAFLLELPSSIAAPEMGVTFEGDIEWYWRNDRGVATVSFDGNLAAFYARVDDETVQGTYRRRQLGIPSELIDSLVYL